MDLSEVAVLEKVFVRNELLPALGWYLVVDFEIEQVTISYGKHVEVRDDTLVEGIWSDPFDSFEPHKSINLFGSCVKVNDDEILICASTATSEPLFYVQKFNQFLVSNSQAILLAVSDVRLVAGELRYEALNEARIEGLEHVVTEIPTTGESIYRFIHHNFLITKQGFQIVEKKRPAPFVDFQDYVSYLRENVRSCIENGQSSSRIEPLELLTTQSKGYDSTAVNALLGDIKPDRAFTCPTAKPIGDYHRGSSVAQGPSDDGTEIAKYLGFNCEFIERDDFQRNNSLERFFNAAVHHNEDRNLQAIFDRVEKPAMLLTGMMGEMWYTREALIAADFIDDADNLLKRAELSGFGMNEVRLQRSLVHFPVPYIGAVQRESVHQITDSAEMNAWKLGGTYDRPIPRRIAEEAGVPREIFGQNKMGSVIIMPHPELPVDPERKRLFLADLVNRGLLKSWQIPFLGLVHRYNNWLRWKHPNRYFSSHDKYPVAYYFSRLVEKTFGIKPRFKPVWNRLNAELYRFSCNELADSYQGLADAVATARLNRKNSDSTLMTKAS